MAVEGDPTMWKEIAAYFAAALSAVTAWAWKHTHGMVRDKADAKAVAALALEVKEKANVDFVNAIVGRIDLIAQNQREDSKQVLGEIHQVTEAHSRFTEKVIEELGKRPTREERAWRGHFEEQK